MARRTRLSKVVKTGISKAHALELKALHRMSGETIEGYLTLTELKKYRKWVAAGV